MITFPINFSFRGVDYEANIYRIGAGPVQYHITSITPNIPMKGVMLIYNYKTNEFEFADEPEYRGIQRPILDAIVQHCKERYIPLTDY